MTGYDFQMSEPDHQLTRLLRQWQAGDRDALDQMMPLVYDQLRTLAGRHMRSERPDHTLRATAVVHEAYMRLASSELTVNDRVHFYAIAARVMRRILLDWAKGNRREKRGGGALKLELDEAVAVTGGDPETLIEIDLALDRLAAFDPRKAQLVEMLFFGGLTYDEAAQALGISAVTVHRELKMAKAWLHTELRKDAD